MSMTKAIATAPGRPTEHKALTAQERIERQQEEAKEAQDRPLREWEARVKSHPISDDLENIIDALPVDIRSSIAQETLGKYNEKKQIRSEKPQ